MELVLLTILVAILLFTVISIIMHFIEKKEFNNGVCKCGGTLRYVTSDLRGGDCFECKKCGKIIWLSWYDGKKNLYEGKQ